MIEFKEVAAMLEIWQSLCRSFSPEHLTSVFRRTAHNFSPGNSSLDEYISDDNLIMPLKLELLNYLICKPLWCVLYM